MLEFYIQSFLTILSLFHIYYIYTGNHWSIHEELYATLCSIQKYLPIVGSCRILQACPIAINKNVNQVVKCIA
jgi:low temperature requirement protein LtrA